MPLTMYDSVTVGEVPPNPQAVAGYVDGMWPTFDPLVWRFPQARHLSIAVNAGADAECLDIERGDATPVQAPQWVRRQQDRKVARPVIYCDLASTTQVLAALSAAGIAREAVRLWTAHYTNVPHLCSPACGFGFSAPADATQYTSSALGRNLDASVCADSFFTVASDPYHYDRYPAEPFAFGTLSLNERATVMEYDRLMQQPRRNRARMSVLRGHITLLRDRIWTVAHWEDPANWDYHRGWRYQKLSDRRTGAVKL
jgi:hypothetical protein